MDKMPHGIVDKQVAGIGATSLEIDSKRNSIIVFPTKILAYNKWQRNKTKLLYVGGKINDERDTTSIKEIQSYLSDDKVVYKKFLVVADSLYKLLQIIGKEHYKDYFLMIDEVYMIQSEVKIVSAVMSAHPDYPCNRVVSCVWVHLSMIS